MDTGRIFVLSEEVVDLFATVNNAVLGTIICSFGIVTNAINIFVFLKNGFADTVNISLLALAISDLLCLIFLQWTDITNYPLFVNSDIPWVIIDVVYLTGGCTHASFARVTSWITAFISFERCLCVILPLKIKRIITADVTLAVMIVIYLVMILSHLPEYLTLYLGWRFHEDSNKTLIGGIPRENRSKAESLTFIFSVVSQLVSFLAVIIFTLILTIQLNQKSKRRKELTSGLASNYQKRNDRTVKIVLLVAVTYIVCFFPSIVVYTCSIIVPELSIAGEFRNAFRVAWYAAFSFEAINSSLNFCVYYVMSSKFRITCQQIIGFSKRNTS